MPGPARGALLAAACVIGHVACARRPEAPAPSAPSASRDEVAALREENARLRAELERAKGPAADDGKDLWEYAEKMDKLRAENARLRKELDEKARVIARLNDAGVPVADLADALAARAEEGREVRAKVLAVRHEVDLVMLSVGSDEKVRKGFRFSVYRDERYIGKVEVEKVFANMCSARIVRDWTREKIKEGDDATTSAPALKPGERGAEVF